MPPPAGIPAARVSARLLDGRLHLVLPPETSRSVHALLAEATGARLRLARPFEVSVLDVAEACRAHAAYAVVAQRVPHEEPAMDDESERPGLWVSTAAAATELGIGPRAVRKRAAAGTLPSRRVAGRLLVQLTT
jgi:hypothetical protein